MRWSWYSSLAACSAGTPTSDTQKDEPVPVAETNKQPTETQQPEQTDSEAITLTFWSWLPTNEQSDALIHGFEAENPGIKIDYVRTEQDDFFEKLQVAMPPAPAPICSA